MATISFDLTDEEIRKAFYSYCVLHDQSIERNESPENLENNLNKVYEKMNIFKNMVKRKLNEFPNINKFFGKIILARIRQNDLLASNILSILFENDNRLEKRISRIVDIHGVEELTKEYKPASGADKGELNEYIARELLAEILLLNFLLDHGYINISKIPFSGSMSRVDIAAEKHEKKYVFEVTHKRNLKTLPSLAFGNLEDCNHPESEKIIKKLIQGTLKDKNNQLRKVFVNNAPPDLIKVVVVKGSDYSFNECIKKAEEITKGLLNTNKYEFIDVVWLISNNDFYYSKWVIK